MNSFDKIFLIKTSFHRKILWGAKIDQDPPTVEYNWVMNDDRGLYRWLQKIVRGCLSQLLYDCSLHYHNAGCFWFLLCFWSASNTGSYRRVISADIVHSGDSMYEIPIPFPCSFPYLLILICFRRNFLGFHLRSCKG